MIAPKLIQTPIADWTVATFGTAAMTIAQSPDPNSLWTVGGMSSVVGVLLWLSYKREERQAAEQAKRDEAAAKREELLLKRMGEIETTQAAKLDKATERLLDLTAQQHANVTGHIAALDKVDDVLLTMSGVLTQLTEGQGRVHDLLGTIVRERPCMFAQDAEMLRQAERQEKAQ